MSGVPGRAAKTVRCAIYTRKSSDEGLEQDFNSLDAQREACAAYVLSQASEGWTLLPEFYDDGGLSGGTLERPALQRLLEDVKQNRIDIIVVYKVDRLTRSLLDFAKLVEAFDTADTSFVSVTQSFNTTTSMGRLTLNMLLSFAQFEREVTAERIRDKIAASKAKGMWMGGTPPLGYRPEGRSLAIVPEHAELMRDIFARYRELGGVRRVAEALDADGIRSPPRQRINGTRFGNCKLTCGQLYYILRNPIYTGDIPHKGKVYPGRHDAIIEREEWEAVQRQLAGNVKGVRIVREANRSLLAGLLKDDRGVSLIPSHARKGPQRYRYYIRRPDENGTKSTAAPPLRLPAHEIEQVVVKALRELVADPFVLGQRCQFDLTAETLAALSRYCDELSHELARPTSATLRKLIAGITVRTNRLEVALATDMLADAIDVDAPSPSTPASLVIPVSLKRTGLAMRLVQEDGSVSASAAADPALLKLLLKARRWWAELAAGTCDVAALSRREGLSASYVTRVVRLVFLAPSVIEAILAGGLRAGIDAKSLLATGAIADVWAVQEEQLLPRAAT
jgi:site-specific DNA recombinase